jgi:hypothetical protein
LDEIGEEEERGRRIDELRGVCGGGPNVDG